MNTSQYLRSLKILYFSIIVMQILFLAVLLIINYGFKISAIYPQILNSLLPISVGLIILGVWGSNFFFRKGLEQARKISAISGKLKAYRQALIKKFIFFEAPVLACGIFYFLTLRFTFILLAMLVLVMFISSMPKLKSIISDLDLSLTDQKILNDPDSIIS